MSEPYATVRYEEYSNQFTVAVYDASHGARRFKMPPKYERLVNWRSKSDLPRFRMRNVMERPSWLADIVSLALVAGTAIKGGGAPYDIAVWYHTDKDGEFIEFVDLQD